MGYNAKYCSKKCKTRLKKPAPSSVRSATAKRSYQAIKLDPERYARRLADGRKSCKKIRLWLYDFKLSRGCADCGYKAHPAALQIDHEGPKTSTISDIRSSVARIQAEIASGKCKVRCARCHSVKTWADKNSIPYVEGMADDPKTWENWLAA